MARQPCETKQASHVVKIVCIVVLTRTIQERRARWIKKLLSTRTDTWHRVCMAMDTFHWAICYDNWTFNFVSQTDFIPFMEDI